MGGAEVVGAVTDLTSTAEGERPLCPACGQAVEARGKQTRVLTSQHNQVLRLERSYGVCPQCGAGFFPLDEVLKLGEYGWSPATVELALRLGGRLPRFAERQRRFASSLVYPCPRVVVQQRMKQAGMQWSRSGA